VAAVIGVVAALAVAIPSSAPARPAAAGGKLAVGVEVLHFSAAGRQLTGTGFVTAKLTSQGRTTTTRTKVAVTAATGGGGCKVLHLFLNQLNLQLLGLTAHLDKVQLDLTGDAKGGVLGSLFCKLSKAKVAAARVAAANELSVQMHRHRREVLRFTANITPKAATQASATCQVLDLIVGPLNLQLLGLVVNLNQVHLSVTATRGGGALGDLFCNLADNAPTTTTPTTPTTPTTAP
jgi:hypothetical protein